MKMFCSIRLMCLTDDLPNVPEIVALSDYI